MKIKIKQKNKANVSKSETPTKAKVYSREDRNIVIPFKFRHMFFNSSLNTGARA